MNILIANDDGYTYPGIIELAKEISNIGNVTVVAPKHHQSGKGHSLTVDYEVEIEKVDFVNGIEAYSVDGLPSDCVAYALAGFIGKKFDLVLSGINNGANIGNDMVCSGTCGAACISMIFGIPAIAFSLDFGQHNDYCIAAKIARKVVEWFIKQNFNNEFVVNCNIPNCKIEEIKGYKVCKYGVLNNYFGNFKSREENGKIYVTPAIAVDRCIEQLDGLEYDGYALAHNYVTLTPISLDLTKYNSIETLQKATHSLK